MTHETFEPSPDAPTETSTTQDATEPSAAGLPSRRTLLRGAALAGLAGPVLAACGGGSDSNTASDAKHGQVLAKTSAVPKGGGIILDDVGIVVTQPTAGTFEGFTNICTHQQCQLDNVSDGTINCICHGSQFSIKDGTPVQGPNGEPPSVISPLAKRPVRVKGADIIRA
jgi:nitrite reductase/ring-hydroxylating ferredoxin subunit